MKKKKILIIDDEDGIRDILCNFLDKKGYRTCSAADGREFVLQLNNELPDSELPDIVLLDIQLPYMNGEELLKIIKNLKKEIVVIMMSGYATEETARGTLQSGAFDYLQKPLEFKQVERILSAVELIGF